MNKFKNMKIEINENQPLDEVVKILESKGYVKYFWDNEIDTEFLVSWDDGDYSNYSINGVGSIYTLEDDYQPTTLAELKEM